VGPNGAGKTTTLKILATLLRPQHGQVRVFGKDIVANFKQLRPAHWVHARPFSSMYRQMTVQEYLDFFAAAYGQLAPARVKIIQDVLTLTDNGRAAERFYQGLSRGMQQRVSLARVLVHDRN